MEKTRAFSYESLASSRAIRLLKFLPGPAPQCRMITVEVEKAPPYAALSYTWGSKELSRAIIVNGAAISITVNLAEAIDAIYTFVRSQNLMFWADSICINQADIHERSRQVRIMNTIYRSAEIVTVWLGSAVNNNDLAFDVMQEWKARLDELKQQFNGEEELAITSISSDDSLFFGSRGSKIHRALRALRMLWLMPWWRRAWIVQEGTVASHMRTLLFCGSRSLDWTYWRAAIQITHHVKHYKNFGLHIGYDDGRAMRLERLREGRAKGLTISLLRVLHQIRACDCEDPRDKLYSALGMAMDVNEDDIIPDYTKTVYEVYSSVVSLCMSKSNNYPLDFLGYVWKFPPGIAMLSNIQRESALPSWVPDWRLTSWVRPFEKVLDLDFHEGSKKAYNAGGSVQEHCQIDGSYLRLHGAAVDRITRISSVCDSDLATGGLAIERSWMPKDADKLYYTGETLADAFNHTMVADIGRRNLQSEYDLSRGFAIDWEFAEQRTEDMTPKERQRQSWMLYDTKQMTFGRRFFETSRGLIGLAPQTARIDDQVWLLAGGQVLYVLRLRDGNHHEFLGECYVHGMMDGQACEDESFSLRDIVLV